MAFFLCGTATSRSHHSLLHSSPILRSSDLFNRPRTETTITHLAEEDNVPGPLRRLALHAELERLRRGEAEPAPRFMTEHDPVLRLFVRLAGESVPVEVRREDIHLCTIPDDVEFASPLPRAVALDPQRGRIAFPPGLAVEAVWSQCSTGFSGDLGGGPYDRSAAVRAADAAIGFAFADSGGFGDPAVWQVGVSRLVPADGSTIFGSLRAAAAAWNALPPTAAGRTGVIVVMDSLSDIDVAAAGSPPAPLELVLGERTRLLVVAGDWPLEPIPGAPPGSVARVPGHFDARRIRAHVAGDVVVRGSAPALSADGGACFFNGLMIEGRLVVAPGALGRLEFAHGTLVPGFGGLVVEPGGNERLTLALRHAIADVVVAPGPLAGLTVADSIVGSEDAGSPALGVDAPECAAELLRSSFFGGVLVMSVEASDCIFAGGLQALRRQTGCVRFSYLAPGSAAPRRYRCQPALEIETQTRRRRDAAAAAGVTLPAGWEQALAAEIDAWLAPGFTSRRYGQPGFAQLHARTPLPIRNGAEDGSEMGAFNHLKQPQRETNLRIRLDEYLPVGLEAGILYVN
jgi:hypothetical protein